MGVYDTATLVKREKGLKLMLILSRNKGQKIMINDNIVLSVIEVNGDQVRIGIEAPGNVTIYREEIYEAIKQRESKCS